MEKHFLKRIYCIFLQTFVTQTPHAEWNYIFPKTKRNDGAKNYKLHVSVSKTYIFVDIQIAEAKLIVNITGKNIVYYIKIVYLIDLLFFKKCLIDLTFQMF